MPNNAGELTNLQDVKKYLEIDNSDSDELLARMIAAASSFVHEILNRTFDITTYTDKVNGSGAAHYVTSNYPVITVDKVVIDGREIPEASGPTAYGYEHDDGAIYLRGGIFTRGVKNVTITYSAGFETTPPIVADVTIELVARKFKYKDRVGQVSKILAGETVTFEKTDFTDELKSVLRNFQKVVPN